jgi:aminomethyltransferase
VLDATAGLGDFAHPLDELKYYASVAASFGGSPILIARTGYTGEDGYELLVSNEQVGALWDALLAAGEPLGLVPAGLAARDTLRLEAGMPLYGHELSLDIMPAQAGLGRVVAADKADFVGRTGLSAVVATDAPVLVGLVSEGKRAGRAGYGVFDSSAGAEAEASVGEITSGALSPTLGHPIAMALVAPAASAPGTELFIDVRGTRIPATVTALPFYRRAI